MPHPSKFSLHIAIVSEVTCHNLAQIVKFGDVLETTVTELEQWKESINTVATLRRKCHTQSLSFVHIARQTNVSKCTMYKYCTKQCITFSSSRNAWQEGVAIRTNTEMLKCLVSYHIMLSLYYPRMTLYTDCLVYLADYLPVYGLVTLSISISRRDIIFCQCT